AWAQSGIAPVFSAVDERGVDLLTGQALLGSPSISVGDPSSGGLSYSGVITSSYWTGWAHSPMGALTVDGSTYTVMVGARAETFTLSGSVFVSDQQSGASLTRTGSGPSAVYTYVTADGSVATFEMGGYESLYALGNPERLLTRLERPSGEVLTYHYRYLEIVRDVGIFEPSYITLSVHARLQSVTNNFGYQLHWRYAFNQDQIVLDATQPVEDVHGLRDSWQQARQVTAINNAVDACFPTVNVCTGLTQDWPFLEISESNFQRTFTDNL
ncbi:MAG TPA: hypothetical protein DF715_09820, partial [Oceanicaulis sp.]|nr:hypothetical protein [Oceanicaulis sp.]